MVTSRMRTDNELNITMSRNLVHSRPSDHTSAQHEHSSPGERRQPWADLGPLRSKRPKY